MQSTRATQAPMYNSVKVANVRVRVGLVVKPERGGGLLHGAGQRHGVGRADNKKTQLCNNHVLLVDEAVQKRHEVMMLAEVRAQVGPELLLLRLVFLLVQVAHAPVQLLEQRAAQVLHTQCSQPHRARLWAVVSASPHPRGAAVDIPPAAGGVLTQRYTPTHHRPYGCALFTLACFDEALLPLACVRIRPSCL